MDKPTMFEPYRAAPDIHVIPSYFPLPGMGIVPINAFVLMSRDRVLVDTGQALLSDGFMEKLSSVIDPRDLRWLFLTHCDQDHIGSLFRVLEAAPKLRVVTTFLALGKDEPFQAAPPGTGLPAQPGTNPGRGGQNAYRAETADL